MTDTSTLDIEIKMGRAEKDLKRLNRQLSKTEKEGNQASRSTKKLGKTAKEAGSGFNFLKGTIVAALGALSLGSFQRAIANLEKLEFSLGVVFQSAERGNAVFRDLQKLALATPFSIQQLTESVIKLRASGIEPTVAQLSLFADTASVSADSIGTLQAITDLFARTTSGGLGLEDLNRLMDRGIPVFSIFEEKLGLARLEVSEIGKTAEGASLLLNALTEGLEERFGGAAKDAAGLLANEISNLGVAWNLFLKGIGDSGALDLMTGAVASLASGVNWLTENLDTVGVALSGLATLAIPAVIKAVKALTLVIASNPIGLIVVAITAAITAMYHFRGVIFDTLVKAWEVWIPNAIDHTLVAFLKINQAIFKVVNAILGGIARLANTLMRETPDFLKEWLGIDGKEFKLHIDATKIDNQINALLNRVSNRIKNFKPPPRPDFFGLDGDEAESPQDLGLATNDSLVGNLLKKQTAAKEAAFDKDIILNEQRLEALELSLLTEEERLFNSYANRQFIVESAFDSELISVEKHQSLLLSVTEQFEKSRTEIEKRGWTDRQKFAAASTQQQTAIVVGELVNMTAGVAQHNKRLFELNKTAAIANATVGAFEGFNRTMGAYPYPLNVGLAGLSLVASLAQVQAIRGTTFGGGGGGGSTTPSAAGTVPVVNNQPIQPIQPVSDSLFNGSTAQSVDSSEQREPPIIVNVNVETVDNAGFDRVAQRNATAIAKVVQGVYDERGRSGGPIS